MTPAAKKSVKPAAKPAAATKPQAKATAFDDQVYATNVRIELSDGTALVSSNDKHARDIYMYMVDCERYCASRPGTVAPYLGKPLVRVDAAGEKLTPGTK